MGQWEPLADRIPVDVRRLATQLRRMKDRSGLTVPALAARTGQSAGTWSQALAGRRLPPLDAVEALAQASGADYERIGALYALAQKASSGRGDRGRGRPVPYPDPLDPLDSEQGLPGGRRLLLLAAGMLGVAALIGLMVTAGPSTGRAPDARDVSGPSAAPTAPTGSPRPSASSPGGSGGTPRDAAPDAGTGAAAGGAGGGTDRPSPALGPPSPSAAPGNGAVSASPPPGGGPAGATAAPPAPGSPTASPPPNASPTPSPSPSPSPPSSPLCLRVLVLGVCLG